MEEQPVETRQPEIQVAPLEGAKAQTLDVLEKTVTTNTSNLARESVSAKTGKISYRLTEDGKQSARDSYKELADSGLTYKELHNTAPELRKELTKTISVRKRELKEELKAQGITARKIGKEAFKEKFSTLTQNDETIKKVQIERRVLASILQTSRREIKNSPSYQEEFEEFKRNLSKKGQKLPPGLIENAFSLYKVSREVSTGRTEIKTQTKSQQVESMAPDNQKQAEDVLAAVSSKEAETNQEALRLITQIQEAGDKVSQKSASKLEALYKKGLLNLGTVATGIKGLGEKVTKRPKMVFAMALVVASLSLGTDKNPTYQPSFEAPTKITSVQPEAPRAVPYEQSRSYSQPIPVPMNEAPKVVEKDTNTIAGSIVNNKAKYENLNLPQDLKITGTENFSYLVSDRAGKTVKVDIGDVKVLKGDPIPLTENVRNQKLGIRCDEPQYVKDIAEMGMSKIRINGEAGDIMTKQGEKVSTEKEDWNKQIRETLTEAKKYNLEIVYVLHPTDFSQKNVDESIDNFLNLMGGYKKYVIELGNEPNDPLFWKNGDFKTFADFTKYSSEKIKTKAPESKLALGALSSPEWYEEYLSVLKSGGVNLSLFEGAGIHAYNEPAELASALDRYQAAAKKLGVNLKPCITELGTKGDDKKKLLEMYQMAIQRGAEWVTIHEYGPYEGWGGFYDPNTNEKLPAYQLFKQGNKLAYQESTKLAQASNPSFQN